MQTEKNEESRRKISKRKTRMVGAKILDCYLFGLLFLNQLMVFFFPDSDWDCGEENFQDGEDMLCNTLLITGPTGVGKTAAVYACAQELGFKVQTLTDSYIENVILML